jgi:hypothetical protein
MNTGRGKRMKGDARRERGEKGRRKEGKRSYPPQIDVESPVQGAEH